jgi:hypothetical protein
MNKAPLLHIMNAWMLGVALAAGCLAPTALNKQYDLARIRRIGIVHFESASHVPSGAEDLFAKYLLENGYSVIERNKLEMMLREQKLGLAGLFSPKSVKEVGKFLGVDALILGQLTTYDVGSRQMVLKKDHTTFQEPVLNMQPQKQADGSTVFMPYAVGTRVREEVREFPQLFTIDARVGLVVKLVDVETGEIIWVGSAASSGATPMEAVESAVSYLTRKLRKDWAPELARR